MKILLLLLLVDLQGCAEGINFCRQELCEYCREILERSAQHYSMCEAQNITETFFGECATSSPCMYTLKYTTPTVCTNNMCTPALLAALGTLTGLLLVILVLVTVWVWTCWTLKKKKEETQHCKTCQNQESDSEEERFCPNQIYNMRAIQLGVGTTIEQLHVLDSLEESGQSINGLSRKDNKGYCGINRVENFYSSSEGSSYSGLHGEQRVNRVEEERECGEKHVYHILEKPEGDDSEEPDENLQGNTAMEYETPVQLKEI